MARALQILCDKFKSVRVTAPTGGLEAGQLYKSGELVGLIVEDADAGDTVEMVYEAERCIVKKRAGTGITFAVGSKVYYRDAGTDVTNASTGNTLCGRALVAAGASDTTAEISLNGACAA
jgi:predicted RecA/RadA family phage recombinase